MLLGIQEAAAARVDAPGPGLFLSFRRCMKRVYVALKILCRSLRPVVRLAEGCPEPIAGVLLQWPFADPVVISPAVVPGMLAMSAVVLMLIFMMRTQMRVTRVEGMVLILIGIARWVTDFAFQGQF